MFVWNFFYSLKRGKPAPANPWQVGTLEWTVASPPPHHNFDASRSSCAGPHELGQPRRARARQGLAGARRGEPNDRRERRDVFALARLNGAVGMLIFLAAVHDAVRGAAVRLRRVARRRRRRGRRPVTPPFPRAAAGGSSLVLLAAGFALRRARTLGLAAWLRARSALGVRFLLMQVSLWRRLVAGQLGPGTGALGDVFFALSGFHALHVAGRAGRDRPAARGRAAPEARARRLRLATTYWDFVAVIWLIVYLAVCVL